jgi:hypothetical protein
MKTIVEKILHGEKTGHPAKIRFARPAGYWSLHHDDGGTKYCVVRQNRPSWIARVIMSVVFGHVWFDSN